MYGRERLSPVRSVTLELGSKYQALEETLKLAVGGAPRLPTRKGCAASAVPVKDLPVPPPSKSQSSSMRELQGECVRPGCLTESCVPFA